MRKLIYVALLVVVSFGCEPQIKYFNAQPSSVACGAIVTLNWGISVGDGEISADQPVVPSLNPPQKVNTQGSRTEQVTKTTTFKLALPYGGEQTATVTVNPACTCGNTILTFTGTCFSASQGPTYTTQTVPANPIAGNLMTLLSDADFPIHVQHANADIAMKAGGGPFGALPAVPTTGDYMIYVPGQAGMMVCATATGPLGGGQAPAPVVHLTVVPTCPP
ncbi:MAG TPA: hypothetical protein VLC46_15105 [Thermoanaerobaculia bacterium]|jgi:hypothetical protein|nr:hypothetical protein [Thermoanaerobaculia bacterium]